jgi:hypothetical protein
MSYHAGTLALLGIESLVSPDAYQAVDHAELRLRCTLPASVREWYSRADAIQILNEHSNQNPAVSLHDFRIVAWRSRRLVPFRYENQGVCTWAFVLDGSSDPPVYVNADTMGREWTFHAPTFSQYVYAAIWDYNTVFRRHALVQAQNHARPYRPVWYQRLRAARWCC